MRKIRFALLLLAIGGLGGPTFAAFTQADFVAEVNLAPTSSSMESFPATRDAVSRFNGALSYTVRLGQTFPVGGELSYSFLLRYSSAIWDFDLTSSSASAVPGRRWNAGLGWSLSFGDLLPPQSVENRSSFWVHRDPHGKRTRFYSSLIEGGPADPWTFYSRDGRYLRLRFTGALRTDAHVDFPGGLTYSFSSKDRATWRFVAMHDLSGNQMTVDDSTPGQWVVSDSHGRVHRVHFSADPSGHYGQLVDRVEVAAFGGKTTTFDLRYQARTVQLPPQDSDPDTPVSLLLPTLVGVDPPLGNSHGFRYWLPPGAGDVRSGRLFEIAVPTGGKIRYWYEPVALPHLEGAHHAADPVGVWRRRTLTSDNTVVGTWKLYQALDIPRVAGDPNQPRELLRTIEFPDGHEEVHRFSVFVSGDAANDQDPPSFFDQKDYGQPFTVRGVRLGDPYRLSSEVLGTDGTPLRSVHLRLETTDCPGCWDRQPRWSGAKTVTHGSGLPDRETETVHRDFDGLGQFRESVVIESGGPLGGAPSRVTTLGIAVPGSVPPPGSAWILNPPSRRTVRQGSQQRVTEVCVDPATGQVRRDRVWALADAPAVHDLLRTYEYTPSGDLAVTRYYGGDVQSLPTQGPLCDLALPSLEQYARFEEYSYGSPSRAGWLEADGTVFVETFEATIDRNTGLLTSRHDGDGLWWTFTYDELGRETAARPPAGHGGSVLTTHLPNETGRATLDNLGNPLSESRTELDPFGRLHRRHSNSVNGWVTTAVEYDAMGRSIRSIDADGRVTETTYDAEGRPSVVAPPGGARFSRSFTYGPEGARETRQIGKTWDETTDTVGYVERTTLTTYDAEGRVASRRIDDQDGAWRLESFSYNLKGHRVSTLVTDGIETQTYQHPDRTDHRGFAVEDAEGTPVVGYDAVGKLTVVDLGQGPVHQEFDRAGRLVNQREGTATGRLLMRYVYASENDGPNIKKGKLLVAERFNHHVPHVPDGRVSVRETYAYEGDLGQLSKVVTEVFAGSGETFPLFEFETAQAADAAGRLHTLTYPDCLPSPGSPTVSCSPLPERRLTYHTTFGALTRLSDTIGPDFDWISQISYDDTGFVTRQLLGNGFEETATAAESGAGRLRSLSLHHPGLGTFYDSGLAEYDGYGKLVKLGHQRQVSDLAYSLSLPSAPADPGDPGGTTLPAGFLNALGQEWRRSYTVPYRGGNTSADGVEVVTEIYVYGPRGRLWTRRFNDFDAWNYNRSEDEWLLRGPDGRVLRSRLASSYYQGTGRATYANAELTSVAMAGLLAEDGDRIYAQGREIGRALVGASSGWRKFYHRDVRGRLLAVSSDDGSIEPTTMRLH